MNSSPFMDKQIMGLSASGSGTGAGTGTGTGSVTAGSGLAFFDLMSHQKEDRQPESEEQILPSYDFQPVHSLSSSSSAVTATGGGGGAKLSWEPAESNNTGSTLKYTSRLEPRELAKVSHEKEKGSYDAATVAEIDRTVKKYADNLMHALEGVSTRLLQLENRTRHLESSLDDLMVSVGNNSGCMDGKLRQLENMLREVQTTVQVVRDKQEIAETHMQLSKLQTTKTENVPSEVINNEQLDSKQQALSSSLRPIQPLQQSVVPPPHLTPLPSVPSLPAPNAPPAPLLPNLSPVQFPSQPVQSQIPLPAGPRESYFSPPTQPADAATHQQFHMPPSQLPQQPPQLQQYSPPQHPQYSQPPPHISPPLNQSSQLQPPLSHLPDESVTYMPPPQSFSSSIRPSSSLNQPPPGSPPGQFYGPNSGIYDAPSSRAVSGQHSFSGYGTSMVPNYSDSHSYTGSPSHYGSSSKLIPLSTPGPSSGGSSSYPRLPTAQILPQAQPTGSSFGSAANRVPVDDIVDKVALMGFPKDQVRAAVRKLTENGQSVDLNVVLDKIMNDGEIQPQKGWFGR